jgi:hypothetical protein
VSKRKKISGVGTTIIEVGAGVATMVALYELAKWFKPNVTDGNIQPDNSTVNITPNIKPSANNVQVKVPANNAVITVPTNAQGWDDEFNQAASQVKPDLNTADYSIPVQGLDYVDNMQGFVSDYKGLLSKLSQQTGINPAIILAIAANESTWKDTDGKWKFGLHPNVANADNYFNIKADGSWRGDVYQAPNGVSWRSYSSPADSISDVYAFLVAQPNYKAAGLFNSDDIASQATALQRAGYAGDDSSYAANLTSLANKWNDLYEASPDNYSGGANMAGMGLVGGLIAIGLLVTAVTTKKNKNISGVGSWIMENPGTAALLITVPVVGIAAYYKGSKSDGDQGGTQDLAVDKTQLTDPTGAKYKIIADSIYKQLNNTAYPQYTDSAGNTAILDSLQGMNAEELKAVIKAFGSKQTNAFGMNVGESQDIFGWLSDNLSSSDLDRAKTIFAPTGLWPA